MLERFLDYLFPPRCVDCRNYSAAAFCPACIASLYPIDVACMRCALPMTAAVSLCGNCARRRPAFDAAFARFHYGESITRALAQLKHGEISIARRLGQYCQPWLRRVTDSSDIVVPVPVSAAIRRKRGFNQVEEILTCAEIAHVQPLSRKRRARRQAGLTRSARVNNSKHGFALRKRALRIVTGRSVALVDDVITTGATMHRLAGLLRQAGAVHITAIAIARAE